MNTYLVPDTNEFWLKTIKEELNARFPGVEFTLYDRQPIDRWGWDVIIKWKGGPAEQAVKEIAEKHKFKGGNDRSRSPHRIILERAI